MKFKINLSETLKYENIQLPKLVPFFIYGKDVGECLIDTDGEVEITIKNEEYSKKVIKNTLNLGIGGYITSRQGNIITGFELKEISAI